MGGGAPGGGYARRSHDVVLGPGHRGGDTCEWLQKRGVPVGPKPFAVGVRIEHRQRDMDLAQYKEAAGTPGLPPTSYKLSCHTEKGRGVFSFCVCPGGEVVAAASEEKRVVTNGMSEFARDGENINGGPLVSVTPAEFPSDLLQEGHVHLVVEKAVHLEHLVVSPDLSVPLNPLLQCFHKKRPFPHGF